ncbi:MAG: tetratricopeptide repeat protein [Planctomycetes bacterium]|nr:tetratricopeptide repeat protein [Planctomycetota bacterium]
MDCRFSVLLALTICLSLSGCQNGFLFSRGQTIQNPQMSQNPDVPPPGAVIQKAKEAPRTPKPATVVALAVMKEREATQSTDSAKQIKLRDDARVFYQDALKIDPNCRDAQAGLARIYSLMGEHVRAMETLQKAMKKNSKDGGLWYELGMCHNRKKEFGEGCRCFQKSLEFEPENRQTMQTLGFTLARIGQVDEAVAVLTRAEGTAAGQYHVARMMLHLGQPEATQRHLELALRADPNFEPARQMLASLYQPGVPAVGAPAFGAPAFGAPAFGAPAFGAPEIGAPAGTRGLLDIPSPTN